MRKLNSLFDPFLEINIYIQGMKKLKRKEGIGIPQADMGRN